MLPLSARKGTQKTRSNQNLSNLRQLGNGTESVNH